MVDTQKPQEPKPELNAAAAILETIAKESQGQEKQGVAADDSKWIYFQQCHRNHPAFFYTQNPSGKTVAPDGWYSRDKRADEPWRGIVPCQECSKRDKDGLLTDEYPVPLNYQASLKRQTHFIPLLENLYRMGKTPELRAKHPPHRVSILNVTAANVGVPNPDFPESVKNPRRRRPEEVIRALAEAGMEVR